MANGDLITSKHQHGERCSKLTLPSKYKKNKEASLNKKNKAQIPELEIPELQIAAWNID